MPLARRLPTCLAVLIALGAASRSVGQGVTGTLQDGSLPLRPEAIAVPADQDVVQAIRIDGDFSEAIWERAEPITGFRQREPAEGADPTYLTEARVVFDRTAVYVAVRAFDPEPDKILGFLTRRDINSASDWIRIVLDSYRDRRTAYEFAVNPVGVKQDSYRYNDADVDATWDAVWDVAVARRPDAWHAEFRIPYSQLRFPSTDEPRIGFAVVRHVARLNEIDTWPLLPRSAQGYVSSFGDLAGVVRPAANKRLELQPYIVGQVKTEPREDGNPLQEIPNPGASAGLDLKYAVTPALSLTAAVNPDFGQVEADPAQVNLTAFELFFTERRPFFIEGSGVYQFGCGDGCDLFYSRRVGRTPRRTMELNDGEYLSRPAQSTILGATKLTGRLGSYSVGALAAVTQGEHARVAFGTGALDRRRDPIEPQTYYSVTRVRREFLDQSTLGVMATTVARGRVAGLEFLPDTATTVAADYDWRVGSRWSVSGFTAASRVRGSTEAITALQQNTVHSFQRPDADHVEFDPRADGLDGHAGAVNFRKIAGLRTRMHLGVVYKSPGFEVNEAGFLRRADDISQNGWLQVRFDTPGKYVQNVRINFNQWSGRNFAGDLLSLGGNFNAHWTFQNLWAAGGGVNVNRATFDDRLTRGGPGGYGTPNVNGWQYFNTNTRRRVSFHWNSFLAADWADRPLRGPRIGSTIELTPGIQFRPTSAFSAELSYSLNRFTNDAQWIEALTETDRTRYVFGRLRQTTAILTTRINYSLTPNLSIQLYGQPFVSAGHYEHYKELADGRARRYVDRYRRTAYDDNADFNVLSFRTTNVVRWEFKPGSAFFVVWQQGREGQTQRGDFRFRRDFGDTFGTPSSNAVLVKMAYWFNP